MAKSGKWAWSTDEESYYGDFDTAEAAALSSVADEGPGTVWVGQFIDPPAPESCISGEDVIEQILCQDEYHGDWTAGTFDCSRETLDELTDELRKVFRAWVEKHGLEPNFVLVDGDTIRKYIVDEDDARLVDK